MAAPKKTIEQKKAEIQKKLKRLELREEIQKKQAELKKMK